MNKNKTISALIAVVVKAIFVPVSSIWVLVEFITYLVKDNPFNWLSLWVCILSAIASIVFHVLMLQMHIKRKIKQPEKEGLKPKMSKWEQRMQRS